MRSKRADAAPVPPAARGLTQGPSVQLTSFARLLEGIGVNGVPSQLAPCYRRHVHRDKEEAAT
jgi:hypothetical protein